MFDVHSLKVFVSVAQNLSFTRAAEALFLTQSAVSHQIARMERDLGVTLFERLGRRVELTRAGQTLLAQSRSVLDLEVFGESQHLHRRLGLQVLKADDLHLEIRNGNVLRLGGRFGLCGGGSRSGGLGGL